VSCATPAFAPRSPYTHTHTHTHTFSCVFIARKLILKTSAILEGNATPHSDPLNCWHCIFFNSRGENSPLHPHCFWGPQTVLPAPPILAAGSRFERQGNVRAARHQYVAIREQKCAPGISAVLPISFLAFVSHPHRQPTSTVLAWLHAHTHTQGDCSNLSAAIRTVLR